MSTLIPTTEQEQKDQFIRRKNTGFSVTKFAQLNVIWPNKYRAKGKKSSFFGMLSNPHHRAEISLFFFN
jgi:hypothetical protein